MQNLSHSYIVESMTEEDADNSVNVTCLTSFTMMHLSYVHLDFTLLRCLAQYCLLSRIF